MSASSQCDAILEHLKSGKTLTPLEALDLYQTMRLAARVLDLRNAGHAIQTDFLHLPNGKKVASYRLELPRGQISLFQTKPPVVEVHQGAL